MAAGATASATSASPPSVMGVGRLAMGCELAGHVANGLHQLLGHPANGGEDLAEWKTRKNPAALLDSVFALACGPFFQGVVDFVTDPTCLFHGFAHGKDETGDGHFGPLLQMKPMSLVVANAIAAAGFAEIGLALAGVDEDDSDLGLVTITLADHLGGRAQLAGRAIDGGGGAKPAQFELKDCRGMTMRKGDGIKLAESVAAAKVIAKFRVLVTEDAPVPEFEMTGEEGANAELGGGADDGKGGGFDSHLTGAFPLASAADGETLGPAEVFAVVRVDEFRFAIIWRRGGGRRVQADPFTAFWRRPGSRRRRCKEPGRGFRSRTILPRRRISDGRPKPAGRDQRR